MSDISPLTATRDDELGSAVRAALEPMHHEAFVARVRARLGQQGRAWEDELAGWFWQGLVAASLTRLCFQPPNVKFRGTADSRPKNCPTSGIGACRHSSAKSDRQHPVSS